MTLQKSARSRCLPATGSGPKKRTDCSASEHHSTEELRRNIAEVERFLASNPRLRDELVETARSSVRDNRRFGVREVLERWRWYRPVMSNGTQFRINNNTAPILARLAVEWVPEVAGLIELRASAYDEVFADRAADRA